MVFFEDTSHEDQLDDLALLACQDYNCGNTENWFLSFRRGLGGMRARLAGLAYHRSCVFDWHNERIFSVRDHLDHHVTCMLFCMDSALECLVFALNALGQIVLSAGFPDVRDVDALRTISPSAVITEPKAKPWRTVFPSFQAHMLASQPAINIIVDNHDVSKHRHPGIMGGKARSDAPVGWFERRGVGPDSPLRVVIAPMEYVNIQKDPKVPMDQLPTDHSGWTSLEPIVEDFLAMMRKACELALADAKANISLPIPTLRE